MNMRTHGAFDADQESQRLQQLSQEVSRIASTLARLSDLPPAITAEPEGGAPVPAREFVQSIIRARRLREAYFGPDVFADPAWDMMLDLLQAESSFLRVSISSLCIASGVPATTALRWITTMVEKGHFVRRPDPHDRRRVHVQLAPEASEKLHRYFKQVGALAVI